MTASNVTFHRHEMNSSDSALAVLSVKILRVLVRIIIVFLLVPVLLLYAGTAVPWIFGLLLLGVDAVFTWWLWRRVGSPAIELLLLAGIAGVATAAVMSSQAYTATPPITDGEGHGLPNSIAVME